ncbi:MAG: PaaI family thioesterase [Acidobacteria bacterium]|nr:PaaI family thioesterase [Acidobacteriota bacterium]
MTEEPSPVAVAPDLIDRLRQRFSASQSSRFLHFRIEELRLDYARLSIEFLEQFDNGGGAIHGGILAMLADTATACALSTNFDGRMGFATSNLTIHFTSRAKTGVTAEARIVKKGRTICVGLVEMRDSREKLVATASCDFVLTTSKLPQRE